jgi:hypothetical protein
MGDLSGVDIAEVILLIVVFAVGVGGFIWAATKDDDK